MGRLAAQAAGAIDVIPKRKTLSMELLSHLLFGDVQAARS